MEADTGITEMDLQGKGVSDFKDLVGLLVQHKNLTKLNLANNQLTEVPYEVSRLPGLTEINLIDNPIENFHEAVLALKTLPKLQTLSINLHDEAQVDFVIRSLLNIRTLNDQPVDREELNSLH